MIKITFYKRDGIYYRFKETGHSGLAESGDDVLCAAISAMTMLIINAVEVTYASDIDYTIDDNTADITVSSLEALPEHATDECKQFAISGLFEAYFLQLMDLTEEYYDYLSVEEIEETEEIEDTQAQ